MSAEHRGAESRVSQIQLLPVCITLMLLITVLLGMNFTAKNSEPRPLFQASSSTETAPMSASDLEPAPSASPSTSVEVVGFRPNRSAELIEEGYDLDFVRCEKCPYGHFGASKDIGPKSPTFIGYHQGTEVRVRATFDKDFSSVQELVVVPPSNGISPADMELTEDDD